MLLPTSTAFAKIQGAARTLLNWKHVCDRHPHRRCAGCCPRHRPGLRPLASSARPHRPQRPRIHRTPTRAPLRRPRHGRPAEGLTGAEARCRLSVVNGCGVLRLGERASRLLSPGPSALNLLTCELQEARALPSSITDNRQPTTREALYRSATAFSTAAFSLASFGMMAPIWRQTIFPVRSMRSDVGRTVVCTRLAMRPSGSTAIG